MEFFTNGFNEAKLQGYLSCYFNNKHGVLVEVLNEIKMLYLVDTGLGHGFVIEMPPVRQVSVKDPRSEAILDGTALRALALEVYQSIKKLGE